MQVVDSLNKLLVLHREDREATTRLLKEMLDDVTTTHIVCCHALIPHMIFGLTSPRLVAGRSHDPCMAQGREFPEGASQPGDHVGPQVDVKALIWTSGP